MLLFLLCPQLPWSPLGEGLAHSAPWREVSSRSSGLWGDVPLSLCWLLGIELMVDLICGFVGLSSTRDLKTFLVDMVFPWFSLVLQMHCITAIPSFWLPFGWLLPMFTARSLSISSCQMRCHPSPLSFQLPLEGLQELLGSIHAGSTGWFWGSYTISRSKTERRAKPPARPWYSLQFI